MKICKGGCHCGRVKFAARIPDSITVHKCNCSICLKSGFLGLIVPAGRFTLLSGEDDLIEYQFHTGTARHLFCKYCGVKSFYVPRSHPEDFNVNLNCVELPGAVKVTFEDFGGKHWRKNRPDLG